MNISTKKIEGAVKIRIAIDHWKGKRNEQPQQLMYDLLRLTNDMTLEEYNEYQARIK